MVPAMAMKLAAAAALATLVACTADPPPDTTIDAGTGVAADCEAFRYTVVTTSERRVTTQYQAHFRERERAVIRLCGRVNVAGDPTGPSCPAGAQCEGSWPEPATCIVTTTYDVTSDGRGRVYCGSTTEVFDTSGARTSYQGSYFTSVEVD